MIRNGPQPRSFGRHRSYHFGTGKPHLDRVVQESPILCDVVPGC